jgi:hypothetical protein
LADILLIEKEKLPVLNDLCLNNIVMRCLQMVVPKELFASNGKKNKPSKFVYISSNLAKAIKINMFGERCKCQYHLTIIYRGRNKSVGVMGKQCIKKLLVGWIIPKVI